MKKVIITSITIMTLLLVCVGMVFAVGCVKVKKNEKILSDLMSEFTKIISDSCTDGIIEAKSVYGKLNGNGNGINYFGVVLVRKNSISDIDELVSRLDEKFEIVEYWIQTESDIESKYIENVRLKYDTAIFTDDEYISICFYNSKHPDSDLFDIMGH